MAYKMKNGVRLDVYSGGKVIARVYGETLEAAQAMEAAVIDALNPPCALETQVNGVIAAMWLVAGVVIFAGGCLVGRYWW